MKRTLFVCFLLSSIVGCGGGSKGTAYVPKTPPKVDEATVAPGQEATLLPAAVGNRWRYQTSQGEFFLEIKAMEPCPDGDGNRVTLDQVRNDVVINTQVWDIKKGGIYEYMVGVDEKLINTPELLQLPFPVEKGKTFEWSGKGPSALGKGSDLKVTGTIVGPEEVDTNMGRMSAIRVETHQVATLGDKSGSIDSTVWYAPKLGIVRIAQTNKFGKAVSKSLLVLEQASLK